jgi:hypothetical protein
MATPSYVIGNSWQLNLLMPEERAHLDAQPWVFVCNEFPLYWRRAMFRPSVWALGDTHNARGVEICARVIEAWQADAILLEKMAHRYVALESRGAIERLTGSPVRIYRRADPGNGSQAIGADLDATIFHFGTTLSDLLNLAVLLNPGGEIRLLGCQWGIRFQHFYADAHARKPAPGDRHFLARQWAGFEYFRRQGHEVVDCNHHHDAEPPFGIPRKGVLDP